MRASLLVLLALLAAAPAALAEGGPQPVPGQTRPAILVGNNWDGTTDIVDPLTYRRLDRINVVPDLEERRADIFSRPDSMGYFLAIRELVGEGHDQFNDDVFTSHDGRTLFVSRPSLADVVAIDLASKRIVWRTPVSGYRSDHMAISPDGTRLLVSASTGNVVHQIDTATGKITGEFPSGDSPHENNYSRDGRLVYHASIGRVYTPTDRPPVADASKGGEFFQVVDARTLEVLRRIDMGAKLAEAGYEGYSGAVRPMALSPDEHFVYFQVSFHHGFVEYDLTADRVSRVADLPVSREAAALQREEYLLDSAHHGLAMNEQGTKLCVAGTMSDYGAIVDRGTFAPRVLPVGRKPYWATNSADGRHCYLSASGDDKVSVVSYDTERIVASFEVGDHPQRVRNGVVRLEQYPGGPYGEPFRLDLGRRASALAVRGGRTAVGCRAAGARELRLARCTARLEGARRANGRREVLGRGRSAAVDATSLRVPLRLTARGRAVLRRGRPRGVRTLLVVTGTDSVGRTRTARRLVTIRRAR